MKIFRFAFDTSPLPLLRFLLQTRANKASTIDPATESYRFITLERWMETEKELLIPEISFPFRGQGFAVRVHL